jgi:excinuclease ABC subunit A
MGFVRVLADGALHDLGANDATTIEGLGCDLTDARELLIVVDRLKVDPDDRERLVDSLGTCFVEGEGEAVVLVQGGGRGAAGASGDGRARRRTARAGAAGPGRLLFTERFRCPDHPDIVFLRHPPQLFSFNNPYGTCPKCTGFGATLEYDTG